MLLSNVSASISNYLYRYSVVYGCAYILCPCTLFSWQCICILIFKTASGNTLLGGPAKMRYENTLIVFPIGTTSSSEGKRGYNYLIMLFPPCFMFNCIRVPMCILTNAWFRFVFFRIPSLFLFTLTLNFIDFTELRNMYQRSFLSQGKR